MDTVTAGVVVVVIVVLVTFVVETTGAALGIAVLGLYALHLLSLRQIRKEHRARWESLRELLEAGSGGPASSTAVYTPSGRGTSTPAAGGGARAEAGARTAPDREGGAEESGTLWQGGTPVEDVPVPRKFALGTVALIRKKMAPGEIDEVLAVQETRPDEYFGQLAVELGHLDQEELDELLEAQAEGLFTNEEIQDARRRLKAYQRRKKREG